MKHLDTLGGKMKVGGQRPRQDSGEPQTRLRRVLPQSPAASECRGLQLESSSTCVIFLGKMDYEFLNGRDGIFGIF